MNSFGQFMYRNRLLIGAVLGTAVCMQGAVDPRWGFVSGAWTLGGFAVGLMIRRIFG